MYYLAIVLTAISFNISANDHVTTYSDSYNHRAHISKEINVYGKGYRYQNRIFYREKLSSKKKCEQSIISYRNNANSQDLDLKANFTNLSIRVGRGRLSSVQFACDLEFKTISGGKNIKIDSYLHSFENLLDAQEFCESKAKELEKNNYIVSNSVYKKSVNFICGLETVNMSL
ncbi:hypothetical protein [Halobacteriovorax sp.]|uniref:hypothetical protein n=1 Tax=Halobacteriovorax sp. TaxID=2020862 RepID=UPI0035632618